ncbi:hypothetical protein SAMN05444920_12774 [Nonomuraea solani]|uniref:Uncharacterized protein n=1 Tax=Nonomuraea solani TaxID=1144553 RepID=A0A1H6EZZ8_9ACTN|nr:hypothetical protein SAMN05444920_12774 [Nonomuraea solani]
MIAQARDLLRWRSPLRTELWAARLAADLESTGEMQPFLMRLAEDGSLEARLTLTALAVVRRPEPSAHSTDEGRPTEDPANEGHQPESDARPADDEAERAEASAVRAGAGVEPGWARRMGRVVAEGGWYGKADPFGEQVLAVLAFRYENGKEPHILVVGIDQPNGGLAVDALVEEAKFLEGLGLREEAPGVVAGRILDAFELGERIMGAVVADTLPAVRPLAIDRARAVPGLVRGASDDTVARFRDLPEVAGAREAFEKLAEFVGDRPLWWSPGRVSQFLTSWLPREAILSEDAIEAMPEVLRAWTRYNGDQAAVLRRIDEDAPRLPALMADDSLAGLAKRIARATSNDLPTPSEPHDL